MFNPAPQVAPISNLPSPATVKAPTPHQGLAEPDSPTCMLSVRINSSGELLIPSKWTPSIIDLWRNTSLCSPRPADLLVPDLLLSDRLNSLGRPPPLLVPVPSERAGANW
eukprot:CAMPEP_0114225102 /NCGR_PEP_ID=MMETSP0058-20121206/473_1 /TAXON_ID=36894 /ORGANISM="Pyramimonas parkeae, CCMP726" /LENGTH=109 /DNA_ID=CAMNT_0001335645 /DNA_START=489 /DNA_END=816 /DNA_ORIENTATION=-